MESNYWLIPGKWANELHKAGWGLGEVIPDTAARSSQCECVFVTEKGVTFSHEDLACKDDCIQYKPACHEV